MEGLLKKDDLQEIRKFKVAGAACLLDHVFESSVAMNCDEIIILEKNVKKREDYKVYLIKLQDSHAYSAVD
jgi:hypothetical protein